jgi:hypothetical protein
LKLVVQAHQIECFSTLLAHSGDIDIFLLLKDLRNISELHNLPSKFPDLLGDEENQKKRAQVFIDYINDYSPYYKAYHGYDFSRNCDILVFLKTDVFFGGMPSLYDFKYRLIFSMEIKKLEITFAS